MLPSLRRALGLAVIATALAPTGASAAITQDHHHDAGQPGVPALPTVREGRRADAARGRVDGRQGGRPDRLHLRRDRGPACGRGRQGRRVRRRAPRTRRSRASCARCARCRTSTTARTWTRSRARSSRSRTSTRTRRRRRCSAPNVPCRWTTARRRPTVGGPSDVNSIAGGALQRSVWTLGASVGTEEKDDRNALEVDGRAAYAAADVPLYLFEGERPAAPEGYDGVQATLTLDERTGGVVVVESQRIVRCAGTDAPRPPQEFCREVLGTGVRLERTITFTDDHTLVDVQDRWIATDGQPHRLRAVYTNGAKAERPLWRFAGEPAFKPRTLSRGRRPERPRQPPARHRRRGVRRAQLRPRSVGVRVRRPRSAGRAGRGDGARRRHAAGAAIVRLRRQRDRGRAARPAVRPARAGGHPGPGERPAAARDRGSPPAGRRRPPLQGPARAGGRDREARPARRSRRRAARPRAPPASRARPRSARAA